MKMFFVYLRYFIALLFWGFLNPWGIRQGIAQVVGQWLAARRALGRSPRFSENPVRFCLPFQGTWLVGNGGITPRTSHSWGSLSQRFAYDFLITDAAGNTFKGDASKPTSYYAFGQPILAAADGVVVAVRDDISDSRHAGTGWIDWKALDIRGNHVVIQHAPHVFTLYAHLKRGSVCVKPGQEVVQGEVIAACGHSGHSTEPHLHFQVQDQADFHTALGLPIRFSHFERKVGEQTFEMVLEGYLEKGQQVRSVEQQGDGVCDPEVTVRPSWGDWIVSTANLLLTFLGYGYVFLWMVRLVFSLLRLLGVS